MNWMVQEVLGPVARRVGGNTAALLVGFGMSADLEVQVSAAIAWGVLFVGELIVSSRARSTLRRKAGF